MFGGYGFSRQGDATFFQDLWQWKPKNGGQWEQLHSGSGRGSVPAGRASHGGGIHAKTGSIVVFGGIGPLVASANQIQPFNDVWAFIVDSVTPDGEWCNLYGWDTAAGDPGRQAPACTSRIRSASLPPSAPPPGRYGNRAQGQALPAPPPTEDAAVTVVGNWLIVAGGIQTAGGASVTSPDLWLFNIASGRWKRQVSTGDVMPSPRFAAASTPFLLKDPSPAAGWPLAAREEGSVWPSYGSSAAAAAARSFLVDNAPGVSRNAPLGPSSSSTCVGGMVIHGGRTTLSAGGSAPGFTCFDDLWTFALDEAACGPCMGSNATAAELEACDCSCGSQATAGTQTGGGWRRPQVSGIQWSRAHHAIAWVPGAWALTAFGGYSRVSSSSSGGSLGLVYSDTLVLDVSPGSRRLRRALQSGASASPGWLLIERKPGTSVNDGPEVRFSHVGVAAGREASGMLVHGGRFEHIFSGAWGVDVSLAKARGRPVREGDFGGNLGSQMALVTIQILVAILASSALLLCIFTWCVRRSGQRALAARIQADAMGDRADVGVAPRRRDIAPGLLESELSRLPKYSWPIGGDKASSRRGVASTAGGASARDGAGKDADSGSASMQSQCPICLEEFETHDQVRMMPCHHVAHPACIDPWFGRSTACPLCKADVREALRTGR